MADLVVGYVMVVVVQQVLLKWDKSARGGHNARLRSESSTRLRIPKPTGKADLIHHQVSYSGFRNQANPFVAVAQNHLLTLSPNGVVLGAYRYTLKAEELSVTLAQMQWRAPTRPGLPSRPTSPGSQLVCLKLGTWASLIDNERVVDFDSFWYKQTHTNVAWLTEINEKIFVTTAPNIELDWRSTLW